MIKIAGMLIVFFACSAYGFVLKFYCSGRIKLLENMKSCLSVIETEMRYSHNDITEIIKNSKKIAMECNEKIFDTLLEQINTANGTALSELWGKTIDSFSHNSFYEKADYDVIRSFGSVLGCGDIYTQMKNIENFRENLTLQLKNANEKNRKRGELYGKIGVYAGILAVIIFI